MKPLIFEAYPGLENLPWIELGDFPTPIQKLERFGEAVGLKDLYIKRDDLSSKKYGGNKVRKLEWVLADAKRKGRQVLITVGATGSNQVLATGIFGRQLGFRVVGLMMDQANAEYVRRNLLLDCHFGVEVNYTSSFATILPRFCYRYLKHALKGERPYYVPGGASSSIGNMGFVNAAFELKSQVEDGATPEPDYIIAAAGSVGTSAGLELGCRLAGLKTRVIGVAVSMPWYVTAKRSASMVNRICDFIRKADPSVPHIEISGNDVILLKDYIGDGYAHFTDNGVRTVAMMSEFEGVQLEHTYTGKALGGGVDWLLRKGLSDKTALFWNTYNSVDLSQLIRGADYKVLPKSCHKYFENPTQEEQLSRRGSSE